MSIRTFWTILLKVIGIFMIPKLASAFTLFSQINTNGESGSFKGIISGILVFVIIGLFIFLLLFKTKLFLDKLHLLKGFDEEKIDLQTNQNVFLRIATIAIGGIYISEIFPWLVVSIITINNGNSINDLTSPMYYTQFLQFAIGIVLIIFNKKIVELIHQKAND